jgi:hypothetical protein
MMIPIKGKCKRCGGNRYIDEDIGHQRFIGCLQCGNIQYLGEDGLPIILLVKEQNKMKPSMKVAHISRQWK